MTAGAHRRYIDQQRKDFASQIVLVNPDDTIAPADSTDLLFDFPMTHLATFHQQSLWRYRLSADEHFVFDVIRNDHFDLSKDRKLPCGKKPICSEWYAHVYHDRWDANMGENFALQAGRPATWSPSPDSFFPTASEPMASTTGSGLARFVGHMRNVVNKLNAVRAW